MTIRRIQRFRVLVGAFAILGAALNAWVLAVHITSVALTSMRANGGAIVICGQSGTRTAPWSDDGKSVPRRHCPICSGLAALHFGVLSNPGLDVPLRATSMRVVSETAVAHVLDRRPDRLLNRGPPPLRA